MRASPSRILARRAYAARPITLGTHQSAFANQSASAVAVPRRTLFSFFRRKPTTPTQTSNKLFKPDDSPSPQLISTDLFHPLSQSPFPALVDKANRIRSASLCPVSYERYGERLRPEYDCPDCGFPTHASAERWQEGLADHKEYCGRLREVNEDEHDIRSGRKMNEFENMPVEQPYESAVSFNTWDNFFFTRNFPSIDSDRAIRHVSKVLTYPITVAGVLHQNGPYTYGNGRITSEGRRSMAAVHSVLHLPPGSTTETAPTKPQPPFRIFLLGARAESTLPPAIWEQLTHLFPRSNFNIYFIGPEVGLPLLDKNSPRRKSGYDFAPAESSSFGVPSYTLNVSPRLRLISLKSPYEQLHHQLGPFDPYSDVFFAFSPGLGFPHQGPPPADLGQEGSGTLDRAGELPASEAGSTAAEAAAAYSPPEAEETPPLPAQPLVQAQTSWHRPLQQILTTKCPLFFTAFSPLDLERDVSALFGTQPPSNPATGPAEFPSYVNLPTRPIPRIHGVTDELELILTPGRNEFGSLKWEIAEWDVRVGVKTNWGVWGIRGKRYEVVEGEE